ncbi:hypothetical protein BJ742DRAFT_849436 [Cladochytrium replicatum]|nr:hypothetical protein BJ742DRAFT_849436 [Cladochytrium replicatum]
MDPKAVTLGKDAHVDASLTSCTVGCGSLTCEHTPSPTGSPKDQPMNLPSPPCSFSDSGSPGREHMLTPPHSSTPDASPKANAVDGMKVGSVEPMSLLLASNAWTGGVGGVVNASHKNAMPVGDMKGANMVLDQTSSSVSTSGTSADAQPQALSSYQSMNISNSAASRTTEPPRKKRATAQRKAADSVILAAAIAPAKPTTEGSGSSAAPGRLSTPPQSAPLLLPLAPSAQASKVSVVPKPTVAPVIPPSALPSKPASSAASRNTRTKATTRAPPTSAKAAGLDASTTVPILIAQILGSQSSGSGTHSNTAAPPANNKNENPPPFSNASEDPTDPAAAAQLAALTKKQERMIKNREAADLSRKRKREHVQQLELQAQQLTEENRLLKQKVLELEGWTFLLREENAVLKRQLEVLAASQSGVADVSTEPLVKEEAVVGVPFAATLPEFVPSVAAPAAFVQEKELEMAMFENVPQTFSAEDGFSMADGEVAINGFFDFDKFAAATEPTMTVATAPLYSPPPEPASRGMGTVFMVFLFSLAMVFLPGSYNYRPLLLESTRTDHERHAGSQYQSRVIFDTIESSPRSSVPVIDPVPPIPLLPEGSSIKSTPTRRSTGSRWNDIALPVTNLTSALSKISHEFGFSRTSMAHIARLQVLLGEDMGAQPVCPKGSVEVADVVSHSERLALPSSSSSSKQVERTTALAPRSAITTETASSYCTNSCMSVSDWLSIVPVTNRATNMGNHCTDERTSCPARGPRMAMVARLPESKAIATHEQALLVPGRRHAEKNKPATFLRLEVEVVGARLVRYAPPNHGAVLDVMEALEEGNEGVMYEDIHIEEVGDE